MDDKKLKGGLAPIDAQALTTVTVGGSGMPIELSVSLYSSRIHCLHAITGHIGISRRIFS